MLASVQVPRLPSRLSSIHFLPNSISHPMLPKIFHLPFIAQVSFVMVANVPALQIKLSIFPVVFAQKM